MMTAALLLLIAAGGFGSAFVLLRLLLALRQVGPAASESLLLPAMIECLVLAPVCLAASAIVAFVGVLA